MSELRSPDFRADLSYWDHVSVNMAVDISHYIIKFVSGNSPVPDIIK